MIYNNDMAGKNFTPIHDLIKKYHQEKYAGPSNKEFIPMSSSPETSAIRLQEVKEHEIQDEQVKQHIEVRPETIKIQPSLQKIGVISTASPQFANSKGINLPLTEEKIPEGLHAPVDTSYRWLATLAQYLLDQSHKTIIRAHRGIRELLRM